MINPLRSVLAEPRAPSPPARVWRDWVLVGASSRGAVLEVALREDLPLPWLSLLVTVGLAPTLLWRRTHPFTVVAVAFGVSVARGRRPDHRRRTAARDVHDDLLPVLPYALFRWASGREVLAGLAIILVAATTAFFVSWTGFGDLVGGGAVLMTSMALGVAARSSTTHRRRRLEQVKAEERVGLARELHDTVAHHVSAIAIQAQAGRALAATRPAASVEALEVIEAEASRALAEMRAMVRVLRNQEPADYAPQPGVGGPGAVGRGPADRPSRRGQALRRPHDPRGRGGRSGVPDRPGGRDQRAAPCPERDAGRGARRRWPVVDPPERPRRRRPGQGRGAESGFGIVGMVERATLLGAPVRPARAPTAAGWSRQPCPGR